MFPMTITIADKTQLNVVMNALHFSSVNPSTEPGTKEAKVEVKKPEKVAKPEAAATQPIAEAPAAPEQKAESSGETQYEGKEPTYADAAAAITKLSKIKGRDAAVAVLAQFGASKLPDVKPEQFAAVIAAADQAGA